MSWCAHRVWHCALTGDLHDWDHRDNTISMSGPITSASVAGAAFDLAVNDAVAFMTNGSALLVAATATAAFADATAVTAATN